MSNAGVWQGMTKRGLVCFLLLFPVCGLPLSTSRRRCSVAAPGPISRLQSSRIDVDGITRTWNQRSTNQRPVSRASPPTTRQSMPNQSRQRRKTKPMPITGYDFRAIEELYDRRPLEVGWRLNSLGIPLLGKYLYLPLWNFQHAFG